MALNSAQSAPPLSIRPSRKPRIILVLLVALCGFFVYNYTARLVEKSHVETKIVAMQTRIDEAQTEQYALLEERNRLTEVDYLDRVARENFDYAKPGDTLLVIVDESGSSSNKALDLVATAAATNSIDVRNFPIWKQWTVFFTSEKIVFSIQ